MKYTIFGFSQKRLLKLGLGVDDALVLDWFVTFQGAGRMKSMIVEGQAWYWISIYEPDEGDKDEDPVSWEKANPNMGISVNTGMLKDRYDKCKLTESDMVDFRIKNMDKWVMGSTRWASMDIWLERCCDPFDAEELVGRTCYGGLDLSSTSDFTAFVLTFPPRIEGEKWKQLYMFWVPGDNVVAFSKLRKPLQDWIANGLIRAHLGPVVDYLDVGNFIKGCMEHYNIRLIACDA
jgi:phage terminase large subunit-like protein